MVQMADYADHLPSQLSGGQQQRIALARALVFEPDLVLLDEPLSNLDARLRIEMRRQIKLLHDQLGLTMIYVTHDQTEALSMADRIAVMHAGKISQVGAPRELYDRPANAFIANFIGEANMLPGRSRLMDGRLIVESAAGDLISTVFDPRTGIRRGRPLLHPPGEPPGRGRPRRGRQRLCAARWSARNISEASSSTSSPSPTARGSRPSAWAGDPGLPGAPRSGSSARPTMWSS